MAIDSTTTTVVRFPCSLVWHWVVVAAAECCQPSVDAVSQLCRVALTGNVHGPPRTSVMHSNPLAAEETDEVCGRCRDQSMRRELDRDVSEAPAIEFIRSLTL